MSSPSDQAEIRAAPVRNPATIHKVTIQWETTAHGLTVLGSVIQELEDHGKVEHKIETVRR